MNRYRTKGIALFALVALSLTGISAEATPDVNSGNEPLRIAQGLEPTCMVSDESSPGTMTQLGFPCATGAVPSSTAISITPFSGPGDMVGAPGSNLSPKPTWKQEAAGVSGVAGSSRVAEHSSQKTNRTWGAEELTEPMIGEILSLGRLKDSQTTGRTGR